MVDESVDDATCADHVMEYFAPFFEDPIRRNDGGSSFIAGIDDVEEVLALFLV